MWLRRLFLEKPVLFDFAATRLELVASCVDMRLSVPLIGLLLSFAG